jgi:hypothetical protein
VIKLPAKSVGNRELKRNAVSGSKIRPRAISRSDLAPSVGTAVEVYGRVDVSAGGDVVWMGGGTGEKDYTSLATASFWAD